VTPLEGDIIEIDAGATVGHGQQGRRPVLVLWSSTESAGQGGKYQQVENGR